MFLGRAAFLLRRLTFCQVPCPRVLRCAWYLDCACCCCTALEIQSVAHGSWEGCDKPARRGALCCVRCVVWRVETPETPALKLSLRTASSRHGSRRMQDAGCRMLDDVDSGWPSSLRSGLSARLPRLVRRARVGAHHSSLARAYLRPATRRVTAGASCLPSRRALRTSASMRGTSSETLIMVMVMFMYMPTCGGQ